MAFALLSLNFTELYLFQCNDEYHCAEHSYTKYHFPSIVMPRDVMLNVVAPDRRSEIILMMTEEEGWFKR